MTGYEPLSRAELLVLLAERDGRIAQLEAENADLARRVARLERLISRNSGNSSFPPSADDLPGRTPPRGKRPRGGKRKPGGQPGSPGSHLAWREDPDDSVPHFPAGQCGCGAPLSAGADLGVIASHQLVEIPLSLARVTQHDLHAVRCGCGRVHRAAPPPGAGRPGTVTYGPQLQAWCVYLMVAHAVLTMDSTHNHVNHARRSGV